MAGDGLLCKTLLFRLPASLLGAALISFGLFWSMGQVIASHTNVSTSDPPPLPTFPDSIVSRKVDVPETFTWGCGSLSEHRQALSLPARPSHSMSTQAVFAPIEPDMELVALKKTGLPGRHLPTGNVSPPLNHTPLPVYPDRARLAAIEGYVVLALTLNAAGRVVDAKVVESHPARVFDQPALSAAHRWSLPSIADGNSQVVQRRIDFSLDQ